MKDRTFKVLNLILPIITVIFIVLLWAIAAAAIDSEYILPSVADTLSAAVSLFTTAEFYLAVLSTIKRSFIAFIISFALAFICAVITRFSAYAERVLSPIMGILRALPTIAVVLLLLFWTSSQIAPVIVTLLVVLPTVYTQLKSAFSVIDKTTVEAGLVDGANNFQAFMKIELPQSLSSVYETVGSGFSLNIKLMVAAEVISATANSLGYLLNTSKVYFEIATMIAIVVVSVIIGVVVESVFNYLSKKSSKWK